MPSLVLSQLAKTYRNRAVGLHPTDLTLEPGQRLALIGPSGSGKSTLLRLIAGLEEPTSGSILLNGEAIHRRLPHERGVAFLPQSPALYPQLTVRENLQVANASIDATVELLQLQNLLERKPSELSGGEAQRVALAKLWLKQASLWLLDEPFRGLDPIFRDEIRADLHLLIRQTSATMILVTHDPIDALALGQTIGVLDHGRLQALDDVQTVRDRPSTRIVAYCLGQWSLIDGSDIGLSVEGRDGWTLGVPPTAVSLQPSAIALNDWPVLLSQPIGSATMLTIAKGRTRLKTEWRDGNLPLVGECRDWYLHLDQCAWFDEQGKRMDEQPRRGPTISIR